MAEKYSVSEAARKIGISRRAFYNWLAQEPDASQKVPGERTFTRLQLERLAEKHGRKLQSDFRDLEAVDSALTERIETLEGRVATLEARIIALEGRPSIRPSPNREATPGPLQSRTEAFSQPMGSSADLADTVKVPRIAGAMGKMDAARLVSYRHGVDVGTAKGWPWPPSALASADAAMRWALDYVTERPPHKRPHGWRWLCNVPDCPCHQEEGTE